MWACVCSNQQLLWQECSQMLIKRLLYPPQWQLNYEANAPFHILPAAQEKQRENWHSGRYLLSSLPFQHTRAQQLLCMQTPKMLWALSLTGWDVEYLSNFPRLPICLMVIHCTMDAGGRIKEPKSAFCWLKEPVGAPWPIREPRETDLERFKGWTEHSPLQLFSCDYDRRPMHTLTTSPQENGIFGSPQLIK